jgi:hypothetical protein
MSKKADDRVERLAAALRENLMRRKAQARGEAEARHSRESGNPDKG